MADYSMLKMVLCRNAKRKAEQRDDDVPETATTANTSNMPRRKARRNDEQPQDQDQQAEQRDDNAADSFTPLIKWFNEERSPPREDELKTWTGQMRMLAWKRRTMKKKDYYEIDWKENGFDFQKFQQQCYEFDPCRVEHYRRQWPVPVACPKHTQGTNAMWRRFYEEVEERSKACQARTEEAIREARAEVQELTDRAHAENPNLSILEKEWTPLGPGVAIITGTCLADVARFFCDCDITVEEHNQPASNRRYTKEGRDIVAQIANKSWEIKWSTFSWAEMRVSIDKFRQPGQILGLEHPGHAAVRNPRGAYGNALCSLILFLGRTGLPAAEKTDDKCGYWLYCASGFSGPDLSKIGQKAPFRMVRASNVPIRDPHDLMRRFDLMGGMARAKAFFDGFDRNVKQLLGIPLGWEDFKRWDFIRVPALPVDPDAPEDDDPGEDDASSEDDPSSEDDSNEDSGPQQAVVEEENMDDEDAEDTESDVSELSDIDYLSPEEGDESDDEVQIRIPRNRGAISRRRRSAGKV